MMIQTAIIALATLGIWRAGQLLYRAGIRFRWYLGEEPPQCQTCGVHITEILENGEGLDNG